MRTRSTYAICCRAEVIIGDNQALDTKPPIASFLKSMLIGGGPVNAAVPDGRAAQFLRVSYPRWPCFGRGLIRQ